MREPGRAGAAPAVYDHYDRRRAFFRRRRERGIIICNLAWYNDSLAHRYSRLTRRQQFSIVLARFDRHGQKRWRNVYLREYGEYLQSALGVEAVLLIGGRKMAFSPRLLYPAGEAVKNGRLSVESSTDRSSSISPVMTGSML